MVGDSNEKSGGIFKGLIEAGSGVVGEAMDKGSDLAILMMNHMAGLISKLSDDIGVMADRILAMEERIGLMADRIVRTEELMAKLTTTLVDKQVDPPRPDPLAIRTLMPPLLGLATAEVTRSSPPQLKIAGNPSVYLLYVSPSAALQDSNTVVSKIETPGDLNVAWNRSLKAFPEIVDAYRAPSPSDTVLTLAVRSVSNDGQVSPLSNSIDIFLNAQCQRRCRHDLRRSKLLRQGRLQADQRSGDPSPRSIEPKKSS